MRYPKAVRKELNTLASTAYEREMDGVLEELYAKFHQWKNKEIDCFQLNQMIHEHHQKKSRELWKFYNLADNDVVVVRAVRLGVLKPGEISPKTAEAIRLDRHMGGDGQRQ